MNNAVDRYTQIEATLALAGLEISVSEVHGTVIGAIANHMKSGITPDLLSLIEPGADQGDGRLSQLSESLYELYREGSEQLLEAKESFALLLPAEDESLDARVDGLGQLGARLFAGLTLQ